MVCKYNIYYTIHIEVDQSFENNVERRGILYKRDKKKV